MKRGFILVTIALLGALGSQGQFPERFKYQSVIRNTSGEILANQSCTLEINILQGSANGTLVCSETFETTTNDFGLVNLEIGSEDPASFASIDWSAGPFFISLSLDGSFMGASEILSVPYALYAKESGSSNHWKPSGSDIYFDEGNVGVGSPAMDNSAILAINSTNKGFLPPRMSQEDILGIESPANGLVVFCTTDDKFYAFISGINSWREILFGPGTINPPGNCDTAITIQHLAGNIAPIDKTVTYHIVTNIPGEPSKCWITSNLGASYEASAMTDATEESAGWYWQFNMPQGYMHDGINRVPNTPWNDSYNEDSDWIQANDPCASELGEGWRIPSSTEWYNIDAAGNWTDWTGPWNSPLKLHAGGFLNWPDAELRNRGISGSHWSSKQNSNTNGLHFDFRNINCGVYSNTKAYGISLRCIRNG